MGGRDDLLPLRRNREGVGRHAPGPGAGDRVGRNVIDAVLRLGGEAAGLCARPGKNDGRGSDQSAPIRRCDGDGVGARINRQHLAVGCRIAVVENRCLGEEGRRHLARIRLIDGQRPETLDLALSVRHLRRIDAAHRQLGTRHGRRESDLVGQVSIERSAAVVARHVRVYRIERNVGGAAVEHDGGADQIALERVRIGSDQVVEDGPVVGGDTCRLCRYRGIECRLACFIALLEGGQLRRTPVLRDREAVLGKADRCETAERHCLTV